MLEGIYTATDAVGHHNTHIHLAELPIDKLVQHITQSCYLDCILRSTELITMSIDTYNEITKWHQTTSQEPNHENKEAMFDIGMKLQEKKILIWDRAEQCLISILKSLIPTPAMPLNDFETIERIIGKFNFLGSLFCGRVSEVSTLHMRMKEISTLYYIKKERWNAEKKRLDGEAELQKKLEEADAKAKEAEAQRLAVLNERKQWAELERLHQSVAELQGRLSAMEEARQQRRWWM